ncbi:flagellar hook-length control protein FliK [Legionella taurinensis]|uniref:Flagellar hook-length control protein FliK n=1 Tax=Legionella taurinensis TaxID=70611 RepID=A0AB38N6R0_9GAMM|nr:flagellar hook-length control protein FliK [Legionella taurinensis]MDX1837917.1 flagellar hook-length control protein FliK [Legionella taurinensis]PUT39582.1 flagellar hook-length control protein FliK [Legionella taurinensis]PUT43277.1 flagellar hook-length control protein FliK [Legionella taurinensis]PUT45722.1 flagellar hook-length control protein FliK [Legionella taurinensis]PUT47635.1 flagellar hook-length control protein FliK [Legionella taurinensis]
MAFDIGAVQSVRLNPVQELKLAKPAVDLYVGQILKSVVVGALKDDQVTIQINGQNINAKTAHHFAPGEVLDVKVLQIGEETILQVLSDKAPPSPIQTALAQNLPRQAPATALLATLNALVEHPKLPVNVKEQINHILSSLPTISQLPKQIMQAVNQSGLFLEANLLTAAATPTAVPPAALASDLKAQYLRLLNTLAQQGITPPTKPMAITGYEMAENDSLPLPGAVPQPHHRLEPKSLQSMADMPVEKLLSVLSEHTEHALARINTSQYAHLMKTPDQPYSLMLDLPIRTPDGQEAIPLLINEEHQNNLIPPRYSISFALSLNDLGDLQGTVTLHQNTIDIHINADKPATLDLLQDHHDEFTQLVSDLGLNLGAFGLHLGLEDNKIDGSRFSLLDLKV